MSRVQGTVLAGLLCGLQIMGTVAEARDRHDQRQINQRARLMQGVASGDLTRGEAARIRQSGRAIRRAEKRFESNDGQIGEVEEKRLEQMQDRRSRQIHRLKHNDKTRGDGSGPVAGGSSSAPDASAGLGSESAAPGEGQ